MIDNAADIARTIEVSAEWINGLLSFGIGLAGTVVLLKIWGQDEVEVWKVKVKLGDCWAIFALLTVAHAFLTVHLVWDSYTIFTQYHDQGPMAWDSLSKFLFFKRMVPRVHYKEINVLGGHVARFYGIDLRHDPTSWLTYGATAAIFFAVFDFKAGDRARRMRTSFLAAVLCLANFYIGSQWAIAVSQLKIGNERSIYFEDLHRRFGS
jgi:hypothetical protein